MQPAKQAGRLALLMFSTRFLQWGSLGLLIPIANLLKASRGLSLAQLGFSAALVSGVVVALELPTGVLADRIGRKRTYLASLVFFAAACGGLLFSRGFLAVSASLALYGVSRALSSGSLEALLVDRYVEAAGKESLHRLMAVQSVADTAGLAIGSMAGGLIPPLWSAMSPASTRFDGNLLGMLFATGLLALLVAFGAREGPQGAAVRQKLGAFIGESAGFVARSRTLRWLFVAALAWGFSFAALETWWQPRVVQILGSDEATWIFGALSTGYFLLALLGGLAAPLALERGRISPYALLFALRLLTALFLALLALQNGIGGFAFFYLALFFWNGMSSPPESTALHLAIPSERRASLLSAVSLAVQLGGFLGLAAFGILVELTDIRAVWFASAAVFAASALCMPLAAGGFGALKAAAPALESRP